MDALTSYSQNEECVSLYLRAKGNSDKCIIELLDILYRIGGNDPTTHFNDAKFTTLFHYILFDAQQFTPIDNRGKKAGPDRIEILPNNIYRKIIVYIILNFETFDLHQLDILRRLFIAIEENAISGYMYIPLKGRAYRQILELLLKYKVEPNYGWNSVDNVLKTEKQLIICNTTVILLLQTREQQLEL
jgi:hypothetical protein